MGYLENIADRPLEEIPVSELDLKFIGKRRLKQLNADNIAELLQFDVEDILGGGFGRATLNRLRNELSRYNVKVKTRKQREHEEICREIIRAKQDGADSQTLISKLIGENIYKLRYHAKKGKISLPKGKRGVKPKIFPKRDSEITEGLTLSEYVRRWNIKSREGARQYIKTSGQYEIWQNARRERLERAREEWKEHKKHEQAERREEAERLLSMAYQRAKKINDWAYLRAVEYCMLIKRETGNDTGIAFEKLLRLFENYESVYEYNEKPNYSKLSRKLRIKKLTVKKVIEKIQPLLETD